MLMMTRVFDVDDQTMFVRRYGVAGAPVVVLVHGYLVSSRYLLRLARALSADCDVYVPDLPGAGRSRSARILNTHELAGALGRWLEVADLRDVTLVANSYGCPVVVETALTNEERVDRVVLMGATSDPLASTPYHLMGRFARQFYREPLWFWASAFRDLFDCGLRRAWQTLVHVSRHDMLAAVQRLRQPVLVLRGQHDAVCPDQWATQVAAASGAAEVVVIEGVAHTAHTRRPQEIAGHLVAFVADDGRATVAPAVPAGCAKP
jgi:2-hydroxy-6-oxonona-2,4-dienedioate hydrolase